MNRRSALGLLVVVALLGAGFLLRSGTSTTTSSNAAHLTRLRTLAALAPCPGGLGAGLPRQRLDCLGGGRRVDLRAAGPGRPLLVNIWATWCGPCVREVPVLVAFQRQAAGAVQVVGVDSEDDPEQALTFAAQFGMHYPSLIDGNGTVLRAFGPGPPITVLVDPAGRVVFTHRGELHSLAEVDALVASHLGVRV